MKNELVGVAEPRDVWVSSAGLRLYGRWVGAAEARATLVLLPGLGFHSFEYERLQAALAEREVASVAIDYRGCGRSAGPRGDWTLAALVADARAAIDWLEAARPPEPVTARPRAVALFGNSLGAMVAVLAGAADPRVGAVVASNCPAHVGDFLLTPFRRALFAVAKVVARAWPLRVSVDHFYSYADLIEDRELVELIGRDRAIRQARRLSVAAYRALLDEWDGEREVARLAKPLLLVQGARDRLQPPAQTELLFAAANEPKQFVSLDTGHLPNLEQPARLAEVVSGWIAQVGNVAR